MSAITAEVYISAAAFTVACLVYRHRQTHADPSPPSPASMHHGYIMFQIADLKRRNLVSFT